MEGRRQTKALKQRCCCCFWSSTATCLLLFCWETVTSFDYDRKERIVRAIYGKALARVWHITVHHPVVAAMAAAVAACLLLLLPLLPLLYSFIITYRKEEEEGEEEVVAALLFPWFSCAFFFLNNLVRQGRSRRRHVTPRCVGSIYLKWKKKKKVASDL